MSTVDQFESVFKAAAKAIYEHETHSIGKALVATDLEGAEANFFQQATKKFLADATSETNWHLLEKKDFAGAQDLLGQMEEIRPDLTVTYRHLGSDSWRWPHGLGECLDVLTQVTPNPVLVLPHPESKDLADTLGETPQSVMAVSGHLSTDQQLVKQAIHFTSGSGKLTLSHVEDESTFERYLEAIGKIPEIDTEVAKESILERLLKDARDYADSVRTAVNEHSLGIEVECVAQLGKHLSDYREMVENGKFDLLVMNAKDEEQMAMHGIAYPLAVELRTVPMLLL
jgi:hypothetical protein